MSSECGAAPDIAPQVLVDLSKRAWLANASARILGATRVGCAVLANTGDVYAGCNVEHQFRSHDIHAETNALSSLVAGGASSCSVILVVAHRQKFTPCGACLDWIFEIGGPTCHVGFQADIDGNVSWFLAEELMPHYPR